MDLGTETRPERRRAKGRMCARDRAVEAHERDRGRDDEQGEQGAQGPHEVAGDAAVEDRVEQVPRPRIVFAPQHVERVVRAVGRAQVAARLGARLDQLERARLVIRLH